MSKEFFLDYWFVLVDLQIFYHKWTSDYLITSIKFRVLRQIGHTICNTWIFYICNWFICAWIHSSASNIHISRSLICINHNEMQLFLQCNILTYGISVSHVSTSCSIFCPTDFLLLLILIDIHSSCIIGKSPYGLDFTLSFIYLSQFALPTEILCW